MESVIEFKLPALGENIEQGDLVRLMIAPGASVSAGQAVMELETDKAVVEVPSSISGTIHEILVKEGDKIKVGQVIFTADSNGRPTAAETSREVKPPARSAAAAAPQGSSSDHSSSELSSFDHSSPDLASNERVFAETHKPSAQSQPSPSSPDSKQSSRPAPAAAPSVNEFRLQELGENI